MEKIAIISDSATDLSENLKKGYNIFEIPLQIIIEDESYIAGRDITGEEVFVALEAGKKIHSSLPKGEDILAVFDEVKSQGYTHAIVVTITSAMSGTYNVIKNFASEYEGLNIYVYDSLAMSLGGGYLALKAEELVKEGKPFDEIVKYLEDNRGAANIFFTLDTLEYLRKGGRIGTVGAAVANVLNIRPIISVTDDGVYYTVAKGRSYRRVIYKTIDMAYEFVKDLDTYRVVLLHADSKADFDKIYEYAKNKFDKAEEILIEKISPALSIHSGREGFGLGVSKV